MFNSILPEIIDVTKILVVPSLSFYLYKKYKNQPQKIVEILFWFSVFLIWSNIPYLLGIINPVVQKDYSEAFGEGMTKNAGFSGPFLTIHTQAVIMASSLLYIIMLMYKYPTKFPKRNLFLLITIGVGLYCLYLSYARTGWIFFLITIFFFFINKETFKNVRNLRKVFFVIFIVASGFVYLINVNDSFRKRLFDERIYENRSREEEIGSGRLWMMQTALSNWLNSGTASILFGYGYEKGLDNMQARIGLRLFAHNGFVENLQRSGIKGMLLFLLFIISLFKELKLTKNTYTYYALSIFWGWIMVGALQEFTIVYLNVFLGFAISLALAYNNKKTRTNVKTI